MHAPTSTATCVDHSLIELGRQTRLCRHMLCDRLSSTASPSRSKSGENQEKIGEVEKTLECVSETGGVDV
eukprot:802107-Prymnesium_polylepis.1